MNVSGGTTTTSRRPRVVGGSSTTATATTNATTTNEYQEEEEENEHRVSRQRRRYLNSIWMLFSPTLIFSKILLVATVILRVGLFPIRKLSFWFFPPGSYDNVASSSASKQAAKAFVEMFQKEYSILKHEQSSSSTSDGTQYAISNEDTTDMMCPFVENGYVDTIRDIANRGQLHQENAGLHPPPPLLLIYLHAPLHDKVPHFVKHVFCNDRVMSLIHRYKNSGSLTCWGGSIHTADGAHARDTLQVTCFPFLALVRVQPGSSSASTTTTAATATTTASSGTRNLELLFRMEGPALQSVQPNTLFLYLSNALTKYEAILTEQTMRRLQREEEVRLREEQDREYREALEADQRREREKREQQRLKEEQERKVREEQERIANEKQNRLENARRIINRNGEGEPPNGNGDSSMGTSQVTRIRLVLPSGKRLERRFWGEDTIDVVRSFLILHFEENDIPIENFELSCNYPKKALADGEKTLESEGLCPHGVIMVQDLDA